MANLMVIGIVAAAVGAAVAYIIKEKRKGNCIGCPAAGSCPGHCRKKNPGKGQN